MTAEVAIVNAGAIALAADSAVTIGGQKIYNSALKLFALSKVAPVGVMIYGNAGLMNVPWEILIKSYRRYLGGDVFDTLEEYASNFITYLNNHPSAFPEESQKKWVENNTLSCFEFLRKLLLDKLQEKVKDSDGIPKDEVVKVLSEIVRDQHSKFSCRNYAAGMSEVELDIIRSKYIGTFTKSKDQIFENISIPSDDLDKLFDIAAFIQVKDVFPKDLSGLVIAGYGDKDIYPSLETYEAHGVIEKKLKYRRLADKCQSINSGTQCCIVPFAQEDMIKTFIHGIDPTILLMLEGFLDRLFNRLPELLEDDSISKEILDRFISGTNKINGEFFDEFSNYLQQEYSDPVLRMVNVLPKDELAAMAEALVNLTAFKRRMTDSMETVGGPIDVLVISKGDGLVWVKRKHYFPPDLNQHFFKNYFRDTNYDR